jgi:hypothetical protein
MGAAAAAAFASSPTGAAGQAHTDTAGVGVIGDVYALAVSGLNDAPPK